ncbi:MAG: CoA-transferase [Nitrospinota bacterium]|nr:MAG: CoA-transferase [Nitrospinota bacterium]
MQTGEDNYGIAEIMIVAMARLLRNGETVFHGVASVLPMLAILLARRLHAPSLVYLNIPGGVDGQPDTLPASSVGFQLHRQAAAFFSLTEIFDLSARGRLDTAFLSGAQIDQEGNINLSVIGPFHTPRVRLPGGAGSAVILPTARRTILWRTVHNRRTFVERCQFVTAAGRVDRVVTPLCVFRKRQGRLELESVHPTSSVHEVVEQTGFPLAVPEEVTVTPAPTAEELEILNTLDPRRVRDLEFQ